MVAIPAALHSERRRRGSGDRKVQCRPEVSLLGLPLGGFLSAPFGAGALVSTVDPLGLEIPSVHRRNRARGCGALHHCAIHDSHIHGTRDRGRRSPLDRERRRIAGLGSGLSSPVVRASASRHRRSEMKNSRWDARIRRAEELKSAYPFAIQGLGFYERVTAFQKALYANCEIQLEATERPRLSGILGDETDFLALLPQFPVLLDAVEQNAPFPLAQAARFLLQKREDEWAEMLSQFWSIPDSRADLKPAERLVSWIFLKPYAEYLAD